jgi:hypothetical protein
VTTSEVAKVRDTVMSLPGMNETVKFDGKIKIIRKNVLILSSVIERGLSGKDHDGTAGLLDDLPKDAVEEIRAFVNDCLQLAGLTEFNEKLRQLNSK